MGQNLTIPQVRVRLTEIANEHGIDEIHELVEELYRKPLAKKRAPVRSPTMTPELAEGIREYAQDNPDVHQQEIAEMFGVNHGRISEALHGEI